MNRVGNLIVISGPSGTGKSTLVNLVRERMPELEFSVSCTTRKPRPGEEHGKAYYFISEKEFEDKVAAGDFIEHAGVFAHRYGTLKSEVTERLKRGSDLLLDIDVQGAKQIRQAAGNDPELARMVQFVMIVPPSIKTLEERLRGRKSESEEQLALRLAGAKKELSFFRIYDYIIVNDELDKAANELYCLLQALKLRCSLIESEEMFQ